MTCLRPERTAPGRGSNQGPLGPKSDALTTAPVRPRFSGLVVEATVNHYILAINLTNGEKKTIITFLSFFLPLRLNPRGGRQTGITVFQVLKGVS